MHDYVVDGTHRFRGFRSPNTRFCRAFGVTNFFFVFYGFFNKATAYTLERIFTQNTLEDVVPGKEVPFGGLDMYQILLYLILRPFIF